MAESEQKPTENGDIVSEKEGKNLLGAPTFQQLDNGRFKCIETGHELPSHAKESYSQSKRCRIGLIDFALSKTKPPLNMFKQDPLHSSKLVCKLTGDTINKSEEHIWKHINGKRFFNKLELMEAGKLPCNGDVEEKGKENGVEKKNMNKDKKGKKKKNKDKKEKKKDEIVSEMRDTDDADSDLEELDFWMPPKGERWDFDDGGDRWGSDAESGDQLDDEDDGEAVEGEVEGTLSAELSQRTKRMSIEIGPSSFASQKKKKVDPNHPNYTTSLSEFDDALFAHPQFHAALQRRGMTLSQNPSPCLDSQENSPHVYQGSNSQHEEDAEENVPETPQYPPPFPAIPVTENRNPARATRNWSVAEDTTLIALYMQFSEDAMVGTNQKAIDLWRKVSAAWNQAQLEKPYVLPPRELKSLECHWRRMTSDLLQWNAAYDEAGKVDGSGYGEVDRLQRALRLFSMTSKPKPHNFTYQHAWEMVKNDPKFREKLRWALSKEDRVACAVDDDGSSGSGKRSRTEGVVQGEVAAASYSSGGIPRPEGVKKAKAKRNKGKATPDDDGFIGEQMKLNIEQRKFEYSLKEKKYELQLQKEMRKQKQVEIEQRLEQDRMDMEQKNMKVQLLQALLTKGNPLTLTEEAYKDQLWQEVYGQSGN